MESPQGDLYYFKTSLKKEKIDYKYEFWSEIIASQVGELLGLNILKYDVAVKGKHIGCFCQSMVKGLMSDLMHLMNDLIKKYAASDDLGEYSKRKDLWDSISESPEIRVFMAGSDALKIITRYTISKEELKARRAKSSKQKFVDLSPLKGNVKIFTRTADYYKKLGLFLSGSITPSQRNKIDHIINCIVNKNDISEEYLLFEDDLVQQVRASSPEVFDLVRVEPDELWEASLNLITALYNKCLEQSSDILSAFQRQREIAKSRGAKFYTVSDEIGKNLASDKAPTMKQLYSVNSAMT